jgi:hypothetical protein
MKLFVLANPVSRKWSRVLLALTLFELLSMNLGCNLSTNPPKIVEKLCRTVERGEVDGAATFFSAD